MHRIATSLLGLLVLGSWFLPSVAKAQEPVNHQKLKEAMGWLVGTWEDDEGPRSFKWGLRGQVITWSPQDPEEAKGVYYWDPADQKVKGMGFGAAGWLLRGVAEQVTDKSITFAVVNTFPSGNKLTGKLTYTLTEPGKMHVEMKLKPSKDHDEMLPDQTWDLTKVK
jgi:hypothetical protein